MPKAYDKITWRGVTLNRRTAAALEWAEKKSGVKVSPSQGSYNTSVDASGTTHAGGGAVDIRTVYLSKTARVKLVKTLKDAGFAAWHRKAVPGLWGEHIHAIALDDRSASASAKWQMGEYLAGRNGLTNQAKDPGAYRPKPQTKFNYQRGKPVPR